MANVKLYVVKSLMWVKGWHCSFVRRNGRSRYDRFPGQISRQKANFGQKIPRLPAEGLKILYQANVYLRHHPRVLLGRRTSVYTRPMSPEHAGF